MSKRSAPNQSPEEKLVIAVGKTNTLNTEALLKNGVNPASGYDKYPVSFYASLPNLRLLLDHGLDVDIQASDGQTLLNYYCDTHFPVSGWQNKFNMIQFILERGADPNLADKSGEAPLHKLCHKSLDVRILRLLLQHHANVNQQDGEGNTPLHHIATNWLIFARPVRPYEEAIDLLVEAGADLLLQNEEGQTASQVAKSNNQQMELVYALEHSTNSPNSPNSKNSPKTNHKVNGGRRKSAHKSTKRGRNKHTRRRH